MEAARGMGRGKAKMKRPIILHDYREEISLDGALMRYYVSLGDQVLAYFAHPGDARLFAEAKANKTERALKSTKSPKWKG